MAGVLSFEATVSRDSLTQQGHCLSSAPVAAGWLWHSEHGWHTITQDACLLAPQVRGLGGHAAMPHATVNPVIAAASIVAQLRALVTCQLPPYEPVSRGTAQGFTLCVTCRACLRAYSLYSERGGSSKPQCNAEATSEFCSTLMPGATQSQVVVNVCHISGGEAFNVVPDQVGGHAIRQGREICFTAKRHFAPVLHGTALRGWLVARQSPVSGTCHMQCAFVAGPHVPPSVLLA